MCRLFLFKTRRTLTTKNNILPPDYPIAARTSAASRDDIRDFMNVWPDLVRDLTDHVKQYEPHFVSKWFSKSLQYNCPNGKKNRGLALVVAYKMLAESQPGGLTEENLRLAQVLGWCVELVC